jgi:3-hydroxy-3-methylglutaryl CoA synthase
MEKSISAMDESVGIHRAVVWAPGVAVDASDLEKFIEFKEGHIKNGLSTNSIRLPGLSEDIVTMTANSLYTLVKGIMSSDADLEKLRKEPIKRIYMATESTNDKSRPPIEQAIELVSSKLLAESEGNRWITDMLKSAATAGTFYACRGGGFSLNDAVMNVKGSLHAYDHEGNPRTISALLITSDIAIYNPAKAPRAEATQGSASTAMWITSNPKLERIAVEDGVGYYHDAFADFTKYGSSNPYVPSGPFSEEIFVYDCSMAISNLEREYFSIHGEPINLYALDFYAAHVPHPKQPKMLASPLILHLMRVYEPQKLNGIISKIGAEPYPDFKGFTEMLKKKIETFNAPGEKFREEWEIREALTSDSDVNSYWSWLKNFRKEPMVEAEMDRLHLNEAVSINRETGNTYTNAVFISNISLIKYFAEHPEIGMKKLKQGKESVDGILLSYGSGAGADAFLVKIPASSIVEGGMSERIRIDIDGAVGIKDYSQYRALHEAAMQEDSVSKVIPEDIDLITEDKKLLRTDRLKEGFHVNRMKATGEGAWSYIDDKGNIERVRIRH